MTITMIISLQHRKYRFADVGKSELGKKKDKRNMRKTYKIDRSQNGRSVMAYTRKHIHKKIHFNYLKHKY